MSKGPATESNLKTRASKADTKQAAPPQRAPAPQARALLQRAMDDPQTLSVADVAALQRQLGNSAVQGILARRGEARADASAAETVPEMAPGGRASIPAAAPAATWAAPAVQREVGQTEDDEQTTEAEPGTAPGTAGALGASNPDEDETINRKADDLEAGEPVQRVTVKGEDEETINRKPDGQAVVGLAGGPVDDGLEQQIQSERGGGRPLPNPVRGKVESALDADLGDVRVHTGAGSEALNRSLGARAFTTGSDIFFKEGEYDPASTDGQSLLAHELTHVVQQGAAVRRRQNAVQRASGNVAQRDVSGAISGAYTNQRREWKDMSTLGKIAMVPGGALVGAAQGAAAGYGGIYSGLAGQNPGRIRKGLAGFGSAVLGTMALPFMVAGGALRGAFQGIANPLQSIGKRIGGAASSVPARARGAVGNYGPGLTRQENLLGNTGREIAGYGMSGVSTAATGARAGLDIASRSQGGPNAAQFFGHNILNQSQISGAGSAFSAVGAGAGILGAGASVMDTITGAQEAAQGGQSGSRRALAVGQSLSSAGDAVRQSATAAYNIATIVDAQGVAAAGAQIVAGGAAVAMGIIDMLRGGYGVFQGRKREQLLLEIATRSEEQVVRLSDPLNVAMAAASPEGARQRQEIEQWRTMAVVARAAARTQATRQTTAGMTIAKGALAIAGGALLLAATATPIGWALLAGVALVGGIIAAVRYFKRKKARRQTVIDALPADIKAQRVQWKIKKKAAEQGTWWGTNSRRDALREIGEDPLEVWLRANNFRNVDHAYAKYVNDTAETLFLNAVENSKPEMVTLVEALGLKIDKEKKKPTTKTIAAALDK